MAEKNKHIEATRLVFHRAFKSTNLRATIVAMTKILQGLSENHCQAGLEGLARFTEIGTWFTCLLFTTVSTRFPVEWREAIRPAIQEMIIGLNAINWDVRRAAIKGITRLAGIGLSSLCLPIHYA